jgi:hypothetical protein
MQKMQTGPKATITQKPNSKDLHICPASSMGDILSKYIQVK